MGTFVLVHGAAHGAWCWYKVQALLQEAGHKVIALDLPSHGIDRTPPERVTFQDYVQCVCQELEQQEQPVTLVGHSMAGAIISQVAEEGPHRIQTLVYLATCLLQSGETLMQVATQDVQSPLEHAVSMDVDRGVYQFSPNQVRELLYHDCDPTDIVLAQTLLTPQALAPLFTPVRLSDRYESVRRVSIETLQDRVVGIDLQRQQRAKTLCNQVYSLNSSHSPFFSMPDALVKCLVEA